MANFPDYYAVLCISSHASDEEIERAYARLRHGASPWPGGDHAATVEAGPAALPLVEEAYNSLRHPAKRRDYDAWYAAWRAQARAESPPAASSPRAAARHACPQCAGTGRTRCLVCEGRPDDCVACGGKGSHTCVLCLGLGTLSDAFYREVQDELARAARHPNETASLGLQKVTLGHHAAPAGSTQHLRTGAIVVSTVLVLAAFYAGYSVYRQPAPRVEISGEHTTDAPVPRSSEPAPPVTAPAPKVLSAPPAPAARSDRRTSKESPKPRTASRPSRSVRKAKASARPRTPLQVQTPTAAAPPVAPAPTAPPPALPEAIDRQAIAASILEMIADWADALADGDIDGHILHYADVLERYFTKRNVTRGAVYQDKQRFLSTYHSVVRYRIRNLDVRPVSADVAIAVFDKAWDFRTVDNRRFAGEEQQRLKLRLFDGRWKIVSEEEIRVYWIIQPE